MTSIYKIKIDLDNFMYFIFDEESLFSEMEDFDPDNIGLPFEFEWVAPKSNFLKSDSGSTVLPQVCCWGLNDLVIESGAFAILSDVLSKDICETYPLKGEAKDYLYINPIKRYGNEAINLDKTTYEYFDDGSVDCIKNLVFKTDHGITSPIFTLEIDGGIYLYCIENFKEKIDKNGISGLLFDAIDVSD
ncbi:hypothetical protein [Sessilibacter sp. MAH4]